MSLLKRLAIVLGLSLLLLLIAGGASGYYFLRLSLPQTSGTAQAQGLEAPVEVIRDRWGIPHIYAQSTHDLFFAQGYVTAQDRLFQMELLRRAGRGALSEMFGRATLDTDVFLRTVGLYRAAQAEAQALDPETRGAFEAYAQGVTAFVETHWSHMPVEFTILGFKPEPWDVADSLTIAKLMAWDLSYNWEQELLRASLLAKFDQQAVQELMPADPPDAPLLVAHSDYAGLVTASLSIPTLPWLSLSSQGASNAWAIRGELSETGRPLLANDPHLPIRNPSIWYTVHLAAPGWNITGVSIPGAPGVVIGHNEHIAWGLTALGADTQDLYLERLNPENPAQYQFEGRWENMTVLDEAIKVKGEKEPVRRQVYLTRHGPLINGVVKGLGRPMAFRWSALEPGEVARSVLSLDRASNWEEFRNALQHFTDPGLNATYADVNGNIGLQTVGRIPIRAQGNGLVPVPGTGGYEWKGFIPFKELPSQFNSGPFVANANQRVTAQDYPHLISLEWAAPDRYQRLTRLLTSKSTFSIRDMAQMQSDTLCMPCQDIASFLLQMEPGDVQESQALELVRQWDLRMEQDSAAGSIVEAFQLRMFDLLIGRELGAELLPKYLERSLLTEALTWQLENPSSYWRNMVRSPAQPSLKEVGETALKEATHDLRDRLGSKAADWRWSKLHTYTFPHPLGQVKPLDRIFNLGPFPAPGNNSTLDRARYAYSKPYAAAYIPSFRQIVDLGDFDSSLLVNSTGQSGHLLSPHRADDTNLWLRGEYHPWPFSREKVEANAEGTLLLKP